MFRTRKIFAVILAAITLTVSTGASAVMMPVTAMAATSTTYYVTTTAGLILRSKASTSSSKILTMPYGAAISVSSISNGWAKCTYNGKSGYCSTSYISKTNPKVALYFPLKGSITRSSTCKTNGQYCDYKAASGTPVYAPADGKVVFKQTIATSYNKLASYGNSIDFTSSNGKYTVKCAHLKSFNGVTLKYKSSLSYPCSSSSYACKTITLATKTVKKGDLLGYTGATGNASGPHIHIEVKENGTAKDPASIFRTW